ncbi:MAG: S8 family serine peptidase [Bacteroidetes bacterium]|uniref:S8 family serine peptidase n=1 Tax=Candidatus Cryptobacteroides excrementipullorum TaxID=2840761 RepID=A0A9D9ITJ0_9BACT|nr:S8 family serine peptidase [Candidatus Cryptobacteroides excrementipullorum]
MNIRFSAFFFLLAVLSSCTREPLDEGKDGMSSGIAEDVPGTAVPGIVQIKVSGEYEDRIENLDLSCLGDYDIRRSIPDGGKFDERHRKAGLSRWYTVRFRQDLPLSKASSGLYGTEGIEKISFVTPVKTASVYPFNDPGFGQQWDLCNSGDQDGMTAGSDINLLDAWEITRGDEDVIVAVCDAAVEYGHEDIAGNIWVNEAEAEGQAGVDDDGNGYVDDIYGWNFQTRDNLTSIGAVLTPGDHGTHIGGTIAAVNNNGTGINGIAGGDSPEGNGVRLMSIQTSGDDLPAFIGEALVYAADNGAVLVNCSWSVDGDSEFLNEAIDYFNTCAGLDGDGNQTGPVAGGLCIFAAGNESGTVSYPAMNGNVIAVASVGADYRIAYYSNYGPWVDITAPGGDARKGYEIYSTLTIGSGSYGNMQGTSMACPHVTGVAALVASRYGGPGFTADQLKTILLGTANPIIYDYNPSYAGMLGTGLVDAGAAVAGDPVPPMPVGDDFSAVAKGNKAVLEWNAPEDEDGNVPYSYDIFYSENTLENLDPDSPSEGVSHLVYIPGKNEKEKLSYTIDNLDFNTLYYFRIRSRNIFNDVSELSGTISCETTSNTPPEIVAIDGNSLSLKSHETGVLRFEIQDADGHDVDFRVNPADGTYSLDGLVSSLSDDGILTITVNALNAAEGTTYNGIVTVSDSYSESEAPFSYSIGENHAPVLTGGIGDTVFGSSKDGASFSLSGIFHDEDSEPLRYGYSISTTSIIVRCSISGDTFRVDANSYGLTDVTLTATDARGEEASCTFSVLVRDGSQDVDLYPNPVKDFLNIRTGKPVTAEITVSNKAGAAVLTMKDAEMAPFAPLAIDMKNLPGGIYYVRVKGEGIDTSRPVAKQ